MEPGRSFSAINRVPQHRAPPAGFEPACTSLAEKDLIRSVTEAFPENTTARNSRHTHSGVIQLDPADELTTPLGAGSVTPMNQDEAAEFLRGLRRELITSRQSLEAAQRRIAALQKTMEGLAELFPGLTVKPRLVRAPVVPDDVSTEATEETPDADYPRGQDAVARILSADEFRGRYWTIAQVTEELANRGWPPRSRSGEPLSAGHATNAVRSSLARLAESDRHVERGVGRHGNLVYYYRHEGMPPARFSMQEDEPESGRHRGGAVALTNGANGQGSLSPDPARVGG